MRYAYFDPNHRIVLGWIDTDARSGDLPDESLLRKLTDDEWEARVDPTWIAQDGTIVTVAAPGDFYTLPSGEWVYDQAADKAAKEGVERAWIDQQITRTNNLVAIHRDQVEAEEDTTLTADQYKELQAYRSACRKLPQSSSYPSATARPTQPSWLEAALA